MLGIVLGIVPGEITLKRFSAHVLRSGRWIDVFWKVAGGLDGPWPGAMIGR